MNLNTLLRTPKSDIKINPQSRLLTIGSCFSDNIGNLLSSHQFSAMVNPFGTIFNPISLSKLLDRALHMDLVQAPGIDNHGERYFHYDFHSSFDASDPKVVVNNINDSIKSVSNYLNNTDILIITFGTSIAYRKLADDQLVSNCHKVPNKQFDRVFIPVTEMVLSISNAINQLTSKRPNLKIITTVSPVRHTKEGLVDNQRSKARLIEVCHQLCEKIPNLEYFPSYELMIDELRDYRFYNSDMIHPSPLAVEIIWERFMDTYFTDLAKNKVQDISKLNRSVNHRPFDIASEGHKRFCESQLKEINKLQELYPEISFEKYKQSFNLK